MAGGDQAGELPPLIDPALFPGWILHEDARVLVIAKPGDIVTHPSKRGPWSSLVGAVREYLHGPAVHLVFRLDRETSGVVVFAKEAATARTLQMAVERRAVEKVYLAVLHGEWEGSRRVREPLDRDAASAVHVKQAVCPEGSGQAAETQFTGLVARGGYTLVRVEPLTGRKHQIRAHAAWMGRPVAGDKIYGPDEGLYLEFIAGGWTPRLAAALPISRQALHAWTVDFRPAGEPYCFCAPLPADLMRFCAERMSLDEEELSRILAGAAGRS
jgi:23S rRNA pseudouridine1911/1915/1917 synthase